MVALPPASLSLTTISRGLVAHLTLAVGVRDLAEPLMVQRNPTDADSRRAAELGLLYLVQLGRVALLPAHVQMLVLPVDERVVGQFESRSNQWNAWDDSRTPNWSGLSGAALSSRPDAGQWSYDPGVATASPTS